MEILFLGTGAADFSESLNLDHSFGLNNKSVRKSSSALIDKEILIDCGPHTLSALKFYKVDVNRIKVLLITHFHKDHFCLETYSELLSVNPYIKIVYSKNQTDFDIGVNKQGVLHGEEIEVCGYKILPLNANHTANPLHYLIKGLDGKTLLYATDGAWMRTETFNALKYSNLDGVVFDGTVGDYLGDFRMAEHNSIPMIRLMEKSLRTVEVLNDKTKIILSHIAVTLNLLHEEEQKLLDKDGYLLAYDGLVVNI